MTSFWIPIGVIGGTVASGPAAVLPDSRKTSLSISNEVSRSSTLTGSLEANRKGTISR